MNKTGKLLLTGAVFDLGMLVIPAADAQTAASPVTAAPVSPADAKRLGFTWKLSGNDYWMKLNAAAFEKQMQLYRADVTACSVKGGKVVAMEGYMACDLPDTAPGK